MISCIAAVLVLAASTCNGDGNLPGGELVSNDMYGYVNRRYEEATGCTKTGSITIAFLVNNWKSYEQFDLYRESLGYEERDGLGWDTGYRSAEPINYDNMGKAFFAALKNINGNPDILPNHCVNVWVYNTACDGQAAFDATHDAIENNHVSAIIGPSCSRSCKSVAAYAGYRKVPVIGHTCLIPSLTDSASRERDLTPQESGDYAYQSYVGVNFDIESYGRQAVDIMATHFNWRKIAVMHAERGYTYKMYQGAKAALDLGVGCTDLPEGQSKWQGTAALFYHKFPEWLSAPGYMARHHVVRDAVLQMKHDARVALLLLRTDRGDMADYVRQTLITAYDEGLFDEEAENKYAFVVADPHEGSSWADLSSWASKTASYRPGDVIKLETALTHTLFLSRPDYQSSEEFNVALNETLELMNSHDSSQTVSCLESGGCSSTDVHWRFGYVYDSLLYWANVTTQLQNQNLDHEKFADYHYTADIKPVDGVTGRIKTNKCGARVGGFQLSYWNSSSKSFDALGVFDGGELNGLVVPEKLKVVVDVPCEGFRGEIYCPSTSLVPLVIGLSVGAMAAALVVCAGWMMYQTHMRHSELANNVWRVIWEDLDFSEKAANKSTAVSMKSMLSRITAKTTAMSRGKSAGTQGADSGRVYDPNVALYKKTVRVYVSPLCEKPPSHFDVDNNKLMRLELSERRNMNQVNILPFIGACVRPSGEVYSIYTYQSKGCLDDVLQDPETHKLDRSFKMSFMRDLVSGLQFIHASKLKYHGSLCSTNTYVDNRWIVKLSGMGLRKFGECEARAEDDYQYARRQLWAAPEQLDNYVPGLGSPEADIYSLGIMIHEIICRQGPFGLLTEEMTPQEIVEKVKEECRGREGTAFRPPTDKIKSEKFVALMKQCWDHEPHERPNLTRVDQAILQTNKGKSVSIMDNMIALLEKHASNLEVVVAERSAQLAQEQKKTETLLYQMLPVSVAQQLKEGKPIHAETFDSVTIYFSDIVGFTEISAASTPFEVVALLNDLYTCFDAIIDSWDVYKVETIGDAYMVVSGLPNRNGLQHAGEIGGMCLDLMSAVMDFKIRHVPNQRLLLRIGIHSGSVVAGVVGLKMPRYCLFGDTVNTASRMESNGLALRIHVSRQARDILEDLGGFNLVERGLVEMKGKGKQMTWWLKGRDGFNKPMPTEDDFSRL